MKISLTAKAEWRRDPLLLSVLGGVAILGLLTLAMLFYRDSGPVSFEIPWFVPLVNTFLLLAAVSVGFLAFSRFYVLGCSVSYWLGVASVVLAVGLVFYVLTWPGLTPSGSAMIGRMPSTSAWMATIAQTFLALSLLIGVLSRLPGERSKTAPWMWYAAAWILLIGSICILTLALEGRLPPLLDADGRYTKAFFATHWSALALFAAGIVFSTRRYLRSGDPLPAYIALGQTACGFAILMLIIGAKRYELWWYLARVLTTSSFLVIMFGLLSEYVALFRREKGEQEKLRTILDRLPTGVLISDPQGRILFGNRTVREMYGSGYHESEDIDEYPHWNARRPDGRIYDPSEVPMARALRGETVRWEEMLFRSPEAGEMTVSVNASPVYGPGGEVLFGLLSVEDISQRKRLEDQVRRQTEELLRERRQIYQLLDSLPAMICLLTPDHRIAFANRAFLEVFGADQGLRCHEHLFGKAEPCEYCQAFSVLKEGQTVHWECPAPDGYSVFDVYNVPFTDPNGNPLILEMTIDITDRKRMEEELRRSREELELRVHERTAELERKNRELQEFAFVASHDLSEPLRKVQAFGSLLQERAASHLTELEKDYISRMTGAANRMQELLDALLRYSRVETRAEEFRPTDLKDVVLEVQSDLEVIIQKTSAKLEIGRLPTVRGDRNQLRQLLQNLLANALKYQRPGATPAVRIFGEQDNGFCRVFVEDNGIGFDEQHIELIFKPFQRLHGKNEYPGIGIGLAICKKIVERHGGTITAKSTPGKGSTFMVTLPANGE